jgi:predicted MFS family arabinose efflux permease
MPPDTSKPDSLKPYRFGFLFSFFNSTSWMVVLGTPVVLLAESLGANTFQVGLLYSFVFLLLPVQVLATATLPHFGYKKQVIFAWTARTFFLLIPLFIVLSAPQTEEPALVSWLLVSMLGFCFFRSIGTSAMQPWLFDLLPDKLKARYFSTDMAVINVGGVIALVFCSLSFRWLDSYQAFSVQYIFAILGAIMCVVGLAKLPNVPKPESFGPLRIVKEGPKLLFRPGNFRRYLVLSLIWVVSGSAVVPFSIYYLKAEAGLSQTSIVLFTAIQSLGGITGALIMKNHIDRSAMRKVS